MRQYLLRQMVLGVGGSEMAQKKPFIKIILQLFKGLLGDIFFWGGDSVYANTLKILTS